MSDPIAPIRIFVVPEPLSGGGVIPLRKLTAASAALPPERSSGVAIVAENQ